MTFDRDPARVADRQEIHDVLVRYCRGIDRCDEALIRSVYHPDASDDHGVFKGNGHEFAAWVVGVLRSRFECTQHVLTNELIEFEAPDRARCESYVQAFHRARAGESGLDVTVGGRYVDRFERRAGEWRIASRSVVLDWSRTQPANDRFPGAEQYSRGVRSREDPAYGANERRDR